jgi:hypothetical protein
VFGAQGAIKLFHSKVRYGYRWQLVVLGAPTANVRRAQRQAIALQNSGIRWIKASVWAFVSGGIAAAAILYLFTDVGRRLHLVPGRPLRGADILHNIGVYLSRCGFSTTTKLSFKFSSAMTQRDPGCVKTPRVL